MARAAFTAAFADLWAAITAIQLYYLLNLQPEAGASATTASPQASAPVGDFQIFQMLVAAGALYAAVALICRHLHQARQAEATAAAAAGADNRRLSGGVVILLIAAASLLEFSLFVQGVPPGGAVDVVGALGLAAFRALPAAATATFFWGMMLIVVAHVRAGGEGGGGALAGEGQIQGPVWLITKMALAAAAALVCLMATAMLCAK
ncbi:hypothetical protein PVAP13_3NG064150 [Panicum virgatum]|uniref:Uncharacterized protein n=1 Tax=Panicum virgatum TaxID=38727 RepID=A0A8T0U6K1_PANVG|nr:hypothetical protein PVAP13_3NG064150 [Panicum virgatum]